LLDISSFHYYSLIKENMKEFLMKKAKFFKYFALALAVVSALTLAGCPTDPAPDPDPDSALRGNWTNDSAADKLPPGLVKTFSIENDFSFQASINPLFVGTYNDAYDAAIGDGKDGSVAKEAGLAALAELTLQDEDNNRWTVTGKLSGDSGNVCIMRNLEETTGKMTPPAPGTGNIVSANLALSIYNGHRVKIIFNDAKNTFDFESASNDKNVNLFFGGNYTKIPD
jgi:hypothetical protein